MHKMEKNMVRCLSELTPLGDQTASASLFYTHVCTQVGSPIKKMSPNRVKSATESKKTYCFLHVDKEVPIMYHLLTHSYLLPTST